MTETVHHPVGEPKTVRTFDKFSSAWLDCLERVMTYGIDAADGDEPLRELLNVTIASSHCSTNDLVSRGANSDRIDLMKLKYSSLAPVPPYKLSYGSLFRNHQGIDQLSEVIGRLQTKPETKQATIGFHVPGDRSDLSCISLLDFKIRSRCLHMTAVYRSQDVFGSQPGNAIALRTIQEEVANELHVELGAIVFHILSAHVYARNFVEAVETLAANKEFNNDPLGA